MVSSGIYRSSYPAEISYEFIENLDLRSMICLSPADLRPELTLLCETRGIQIVSFDLKLNQEPFLTMSENLMHEATDFALSTANQPVLIFCTNGKVKTGATVACIRKKQGWGFTSCLAEFDLFSEPDGGLADHSFIDSFEVPIPTTSTATTTTSTSTVPLASASEK